MDSEIEFLWKIYDTINDWIRFSDTKAIAIVATYGIAIGFISSNVTELQQIMYKSPEILLLSLITVLLAFSSIYYCIGCLIPRLKVEEPDLLIFFAHIPKKI